jgi:peptidylprolyl isomerase
MARKRDRVFALVVALAFLVTTVGVSVALIFQIVNEGKDTPAAETETSTNTDAETKSQPTTLKGNDMDGFTPTAAKIEKLEVIDLTPGTGAEVKASDTVTVDYIGVTSTDGKVFDSSFDHGQQVTFSLSQVIPGWSEGIVGMKEGGKRRLLIPAAKAYGANPPQGSGIPANADLVFDVTLHKVGQ